MPHRTRAWIWAGRAAASAAVIGLAGYMYAARLDQAVKLAAPIGLVIALSALVAPYLLPACQPPAPPPVRRPIPATGRPQPTVTYLTQNDLQYWEHWSGSRSRQNPSGGARRACLR